MIELYEGNATAVYRVCQRLLKNAEDAADATQEVFLRAVISLTAETERDRARAWLMTVARHHCLDVLRRKKRLGKALTTLGAEPIREGEAERSVVDRDYVHGILGQLRERERQVLWQSAVEYRPIGEIGSYLGLSYMAAAQLLHRARRHASVVAAKLAAIFGLLQVNRLAKRPAFGVELQPLAVALVVPLVVAGLVGASSSPPASARPFAGSARIAIGSPATGGAATTSSTSPAVVHQVQSTVNALVTGVLPVPSPLIPTVLPVPTPSVLLPHLPSITSG